MKKAVKKVVLAYSGGLDTSVILRWLQDAYGCEVVTFTADIGQGEELEPARAKAKMFGVEKAIARANGKGVREATSWSSLSMAASGPAARPAWR